MNNTSSVVWRRSRQRQLHIVCGVVLGTYLYSPLAQVSGVELFVQAVVFPLLAISGLVLWKGPRLRRWYRSRQTDQRS